MPATMGLLMIKLLFILLLIPSVAFAGADTIGGVAVTDINDIGGVPIEDIDTFGGVEVGGACTEEESFGATDDAYYSFFEVSGTKWAGLEFVPASSYTITQFALKLYYRDGSPSGTVTPYIYSTTSDHPNASLGSGSAVNIADLPASADYHVFTLTSGIALTSGVHYWAVLVSSSTGAAQKVSIRFDSTDSYDLEIDADGVSWTEIYSSEQTTIKTYVGNCP